ncbi:chitinase-3-like protein 1 [Calliopsis andreniformis]|uniref:chitinase-3-like protein 1 n=1 Tax=Calliopsis andreniformis TaxID=337506 RepID=UPI003FCE1829
MAWQYLISIYVVFSGRLFNFLITKIIANNSIIMFEKAVELCTFLAIKYTTLDYLKLKRFLAIVSLYYQSLVAFYHLIYIRIHSMHTKILFLFAFLAMTAAALAESKFNSFKHPILPKKIVCYYESWAKYRKGEGKYTIHDIPANLCTHVLYSFVGINTDGSVKLLDDAQDLSQFTSFIKRHNGVKPVLSIGGASEGSKKFSEVVSNQSTRERFVRNVVAFLEKYHFEGLDVDWEYPSQNGGRKSDKRNFVLLLKELKQAFSSKGYSLSAAVGADSDSAPKSYDIPEISKYLDFINIMTYDFNGNWNHYTGMNSPLYPGPKDDSYQRTLNINAIVEYWLSHGAPREKIIVGLPFYGITFTLKNPDEHGLYAPTTGPGKSGPYTDEAGTIGYNEMCVKIHEGGWNIVHTKKERVPYAYKHHQWISYDNPESIREKAEYIKSKNLGGAMIWSIDTDDFKGACGPKHVLLKAVHNTLK